MSERPILFKAAMVRAILEGRKTQTRRVVKPQFDGVPECGERDGGEWSWFGSLRASLAHDSTGCFGTVKCPYGMAGDRLWVRETWNVDQCYNDLSPSDLPGSLTDSGIATDPQIGDVGFQAGFGMQMTGRWRPSIHMPRWASRLNLGITGVRVERLNQISEEDAMAEGIQRYKSGGIFAYGVELESRDDAEATARMAFRSLFQSINGPASWDRNPWVWVVEFKPVRSESLNPSTPETLPA